VATCHWAELRSRDDVAQRGIVSVNVPCSALISCLCLAFCRICNQDIVSRVKQVICFAFHDSRLLLETCREASEQRRVVALFYLD
jgi:hypothetical protein